SCVVASDVHAVTVRSLPHPVDGSLAPTHTVAPDTGLPRKSSTSAVSDQLVPVMMFAVTVTILSWLPRSAACVAVGANIAVSTAAALAATSVRKRWLMRPPADPSRAPGA